MPDIVVPLDRWITLSGPPGPADGVLGTYAIDIASSSYDLYVKQEAGWVFLVSLIGPQGDTGASAYDIAIANGFSGTEAAWLDSLVGPQGDRGYTILSGASDPVPSDGIDGDFWLNTASSTLFGPKAGGAFPAGVSLIGPTGAGVPSGGADGQYIRHDGVTTVWESPSGGLATTSAAGFQSASDKTKLDGVRPNDAFCSVGLSAAQTGISHATWTDVLWDVETDPRNMHDSVNPQRITVDSTGLYGASAYMLWDTLDSTGGRGIRILVFSGAGVFLKQVQDWVAASVVSNGPCTTYVQVSLNVGEYIIVQVRQDSGAGAFSLSSATNATIGRLA